MKSNIRTQPSSNYSLSPKLTNNIKFVYTKNFHPHRAILDSFQNQRSLTSTFNPGSSFSKTENSGFIRKISSRAHCARRRNVGRRERPCGNSTGQSNSRSRTQVSKETVYSKTSFKSNSRFKTSQNYQTNSTQKSQNRINKSDSAKLLKLDAKLKKISRNLKNMKRKKNYKDKKKFSIEKNPFKKITKRKFLVEREKNQIKQKTSSRINFKQSITSDTGHNFFMSSGSQNQLMKPKFKKKKNKNQKFLKS